MEGLLERDNSIGDMEFGDIGEPMKDAGRDVGG